MDTGIEATHPDLVNRVSTGLGQRFDDSAPARARTYLEDANGHGTHVAGIIGAEGNNSRGIVGTCWDVKLVSIAVCSFAGFPEIEHVVDGIEYAEEIGIDILNYSAGGATSTNAEAYYNAISSYSGLFVCGAGNLEEGQSQFQGDNDVYPHFPSNLNLSNVIAVGASTENDTKAEFSHYGANTVDIFAPGEGILSCYPEWVCDSKLGPCDEPKTHTATYYHTLSGTSMATPYVTGVAALLLSANPDLLPCEIKDTILFNVDEISALADYCVTGGRLNAYKALTNVIRHPVTYSDCTNAGHVRTCATHHFSKRVSHSYACSTDSSGAHNYTCSQCDFSSQEGQLIHYISNGVNGGHTGFCTMCDYHTEIEAHTWVTSGLRFRCGRCGIITTAIPTPFASLPPEIRAKLEQMNYVGDFAMDIGGGTVLCRIGDQYYLVKGQSEDTALAYLQTELSVITPDVQTE